MAHIVSIQIKVHSQEMTSYAKENPHSSHQTLQPGKVSYKTRHGELYDSARRVIQPTMQGYKIYADERKYISSQIDIIIKITTVQ